MAKVTAPGRYFTIIDLATAPHPQTITALDHGGALFPPEYGAPTKPRILIKLGYRNSNTSRLSA